jgi:hypothetical protein
VKRAIHPRNFAALHLALQFESWNIEEAQLKKEVVYARRRFLKDYVEDDGKEVVYARRRFLKDYVEDVQSIVKQVLNARRKL